LRLLVYQKYLNNNLFIEKQNKILQLLKKIENYENIHVDIVKNDIKEVEYFLLIRKYTIFITDKSFLKLSKKSLDIYSFFTTIIIIDENLTIEEEKELYKSGVHQIIDIKDELFYEKILSIKSFDISNILQFVNFKINMSSKKVYINNIQIREIKGKIYDIFIFLIINNTITFSKNEIINFVFEEPEYANENSVDTYLSTLKKIINEYSDRIKMNVINKEGYNISIISNYKKKDIIYEI